MKNIDADYYGYRDEDDGVLVPLELEYEKKARAMKVAEWKEHKEAILRGEVVPSTATGEERDIYSVQEDSDEEMELSFADTSVANPQFIAHVPVPSQKDVEEALVRRKKMELLQRYASEALQQEEDNVKKLLGVSD